MWTSSMRHVVGAVLAVLLVTSCVRSAPIPDSTMDGPFRGGVWVSTSTDDRLELDMATGRGVATMSKGLSASAGDPAGCAENEQWSATSTRAITKWSVSETESILRFQVPTENLLLFSSVGFAREGDWSVLETFYRCDTEHSRPIYLVWQPGSA